MNSLKFDGHTQPYTPPIPNTSENPKQRSATVNSIASKILHPAEKPNDMPGRFSFCNRKEGSELPNIPFDVFEALPEMQAPVGVLALQEERAHISQSPFRVPNLSGNKRPR
jgi:hypothetical protein